MKRVIAILLTTLLSVALVATTPLAAEAKKKKHHDTPGCVTRAEYRAAHGGMTPLDVRNDFDTWGRVRFYNDHGFWAGDWVDDGYWVNDGYWESQYDDLGNYTGDDWVDTSYWEDTSYWDDTAYWEPVIDIVRTYKKCRTFNHGKGRVAINFDNYSREWLDGPRVAYKNPSDPAFMDIAASFRVGQAKRLAGKELPALPTRASTPKPTGPNSPKPMPRPIGPEPTAAHS